MTAPALIIPVETKVREFDAKLLFSCVAAEAGHRVVFGSQRNIHLRIDSLPRGVYLTKDVRASKLRVFDILGDLGTAIVGWDEEGLVRYPSAHYFKMRVSPEALARVALWFAWGAEDAATMRTFPAFPGTPIHTVGNPRVDVLRRELRPYYDPEVNALRERFGRFVLINTNFGHSNHFLAKYTVRTEEFKEEMGEKDTSWDRDLAVHRDAMFRHFQAMIPALARALPGTTIVVRPHPSEGDEVWRAAAAGAANVQVVHEGSVLPWLLAADVLVHNGCTTAVEAFLLDRPAVTYKPIVSERFDRHLPDGLSVEAPDLDALVGEVESFVAGRDVAAVAAARRALLDRHIAPQGADLAAERVVRIVGEAGVEPTRGRAALVGQLKAKARAVQKLINTYVPGSKNWSVYEKRRFAATGQAEVEDRIARFSALLGRFGAVRAHALAEDVFEITT